MVGDGKGKGPANTSSTTDGGTTPWAIRDRLSATTLETVYRPLFQARVTNPSSVNIGQIPNKGKGFIALTPLEEDTVIFHDRPLLCMQHHWNSDRVPTCRWCLQVLGTLPQQLCNLALVDPQTVEEGILTSPPMKEECDEGVKETRIVPCVQSCGAYYCSESCRDADWAEGHRMMCFGANPSEDHPLVKHRKHAIETNETFILAARLIAKVMSNAIDGMGLERAWDVFRVYQKEEWTKIVSQSRDVAESEVKDWLLESLSYLRNAWSMHLQDFEQLLSAETFNLIMGMFELNNLDIEITHPVAQYICNLQDHSPEALQQVVPLLELMKSMEEQCDEGDQAEGDDDMEMDDGDEDEAPYACIPKVAGIGLFPLQPVVRLDEDDNKELYALAEAREAATQQPRRSRNEIIFVKTLRPINPGEEITVSYVEEEGELDERTEELAEYLIQNCDCSKCIRERS